MSDESESQAQAELPRYKCHKRVWALKIAEFERRKPTIAEVQRILDGKAEDGDGIGGFITPEDKGYARFPVSDEFVKKHDPQAGGYYVVYTNGYKSFSPAEAFEDGYTTYDPKLANALHWNEGRKKMVWSRDRRLNTSHDPYTADELLDMFGPYLREFEHNGLDPREIRLLETVISLLT